RVASPWRTGRLPHCGGGAPPNSRGGSRSMSGVRKWRMAALTLAAAMLVSGIFVFGASGRPVKTWTIGVALIGPKNDKSFNQAAYEGVLQAVKQSGGQYKLKSVLENLATDQQRTRAIETLSPIANIVVAVSNSFGPVLDVEADKFP